LPLLHRNSKGVQDQRVDWQMIAGALERLSLAQLIEEWNRCTRSVEHARDIGQSNPEDEAALVGIETELARRAYPTKDRQRR